MNLYSVRKIHVQIEEIRHDGGPPPAKPQLRGAIAAVISNPYAGKHVTDITPMMDALKPLGLELTNRLVALLGGAEPVEAYGKASIIGTDGELEHGALWHVPGGYAMREVLGSAKAIVPSATKVGAAGTSIDIPIHHKDAAYVRSHFDAIEMRVADAPRPGEIVYLLGMTTGGRVHARVGGLAAKDIKGEDGQR